MTRTRNPFEFGRELGTDELVDRDAEIAAVVDAIRDGQRLFLIGPRRFGKTSILHVVEEKAETEGITVFRHNVEAYVNEWSLADAIATDAVQLLRSPIEKIGEKLKSFFAGLRPNVLFNPMTQVWSVSLSPRDTESDGSVLLSGVLDAVDRMAKSSGKRVGIILDEFQQLVIAGGERAEARIRAAVQQHRHLAYVFAGSQTTMMSEMTGDRNRPFYRLGSRLFLESIPRQDFRSAIKRGFRRGARRISDGAIERILDLAADVPYNVQRLAHACWQNAQVGRRKRDVAPDEVDDALIQLVRRDDPFYTQSWTQLTRNQQKALLAVTETSGEAIYASETLSRFDIVASTMGSSLQSLVRSGILRTSARKDGARYELEDPFFAAWLDTFVRTR